MQKCVLDAICNTAPKSTNNGLVSIVVPVYNVQKYLERCLKSIQSQTYQNIEVIIVNDGSTDDSNSIAIEYAKTDKRFKLFQKENGGLSSARNYGLKLVTGNYIAFVDSDDWINQEYIETLLYELIATGSDIAVCGSEHVMENGIRKKHYGNYSRKTIINDVFEYLKTASNVVWNKLYKKEIIDGLFFPEGINFEDYFFTPQAVSRARKIVVIPDILYYYFWRPDSITNIKKTPWDIYKSHCLLEKTEFAKRHKDVMKVFFVRKILASLIWALLRSKNNIAKVDFIMSNAKKKYKGLRTCITQEYVGKNKLFFGLQVYKGHYKIAACYVLIYEYGYRLLRPLYYYLLKLRKPKTK